MIIHLNSWPGVGKFTVAKILAQKLNARLIDNHAVIDIVTACCDRGVPDYFIMIQEVCDLVFKRMSNELDKTYIFTNALSAQYKEDIARLENIRSYASRLNKPFLQILLECDEVENSARIISESRQNKGKLMDSDKLSELRENYSIYHPEAKHRLTVDTTNLSPEQVSEVILNYISNLGGPEGTRTPTLCSART
jgi:thymidylate kinase